MKTNMAFAETLTSALRQTSVGVARGDATLWKEEEKANHGSFPKIYFEFFQFLIYLFIQSTSDLYVISFIISFICDIVIDI